MAAVNRPLLIAMKGHPGAGKSAVARGLSRRLGIPLIDKDDIKDVLDGHVADAGGLAYIAMFNVARRQLLQTLSVICDSPLSEVGGYTTACVVAHDTGARLLVIECVCSSEEEWRRRIEQRAALRLPSHHVTTWEHLQEHLRRRADVSNYAIHEPHLVVDTFAPLEEVLHTILAWIETVCTTPTPAGVRRENPVK
ncbi:MAG: ATP-binding protein [Roseiflexus castenholzii]|uniref:AAA family ATPase n=1 Tax=Roseiflexus castenholzii TaxID=120962 RepID=UPI000CAF0778|nr:MAG: ATP-binding protein [Roseiflexus castenholzii]